jgi:hypothetical protein
MIGMQHDILEASKNSSDEDPVHPKVKNGALQVLVVIIAPWNWRLILHGLNDLDSHRQ